MRKTLASLVAIMWMMGAAGRAFVQQGVDPAALPDGDGKTILFRACSDCHDLGSVVAKRLTPRQWSDVTKDMVSRGVQAEPAEIATLIEYLSVNVGHVNVNLATESELRTYGGFSAADASTILGARTRGQVFATLADLKALPGLDLKSLEDRKDRIAFKDR